jgi:hypothetical protein
MKPRTAIRLLLALSCIGIISTVLAAQFPITITVTPITSGGPCGSPNADSGTDISIDYSQGCTAYPAQLSAYVSTVNMMPFSGQSGVPISNANMKALGMKLQRTFWGPSCWSVAPGNNNFNCEPNGYGGDPILNSISNDGSIPVIAMGGGVNNPGASWETLCVWTGTDKLPCNVNEQVQLWVTGLNHLLSAYPNIQYIESANEPDYGGWNIATTEEQYRRLSLAVTQVNNAIGSKHFLLGGPAWANCYSDTASFVAYVNANSLPLDFISYHAYYDTVTNCANVVKNAAASQGAGNVQHLVTEYGDIPIEGTQQEAAYVAQDYYYLLADNLGAQVLPFPWERTTYVDFSQVDSQVGPEYNEAMMFHMHKGQRISPTAITGPASKYHPIATKDTTGVALTLSTYGSTGSFNVHLNNLPAAFTGGTFTWTEYLMDSTHGNCYANCANNGALPTIASGSNPAASSFNLPVNMGDPNAMLMLVLTPAPSGGVAFDYGPNGALPTGQAGVDLAAAGFTHGILNADFTDTSGHPGGSVISYTMNNPNTYINQCGGTTDFGKFWIGWGAYADQTNSDQGGPAACNRFSLVSDAGTQVLNFQFSNSDAIDGNHQSLALWWPQCGNRCSPNVALPSAIYYEITFRLAAGVAQSASNIILSLDSMSLYDADPNEGPSGWQDFVILEALANNHPATGWMMDNYLTASNSGGCASAKCSSGFIGASDLGNYHTMATLVTTNNSVMSICQYMDNTGMALPHQTFNGATFDGTYCQHVTAWLPDELNPHDRRIYLSLGPYPFGSFNPISVNIKSIKIVACNNYTGRGNNCVGPVVWH